MTDLLQRPMPNPSTLWARVLVDALVRAGLQAVCVAPGSRSTPLALAFAESAPAVKLYTHLDERSAAFFALGYALATQQPVALVCTSGTAAVNFYPAVVEAHESHVPLLLLTADRPHVLRDSGANQTIDQVKLYGDYAHWSVDLAPPEANPSALTVRALRATAARALAVARGHGPHLAAGPVHINVPFAKPLEPTPTPGHATLPPDDIHEGTVQFLSGQLEPEADTVRALTDVLGQATHGLIVCGPRCPGPGFPAAVGALAAKLGWPLLADGTSGVRFGPASTVACVAGHYDAYLPTSPPWPVPEVVLRFGGVPTSNALNTYLDGLTLTARIHVSAVGTWADDTHRTTHLIRADEVALARALAAALPARPQEPLRAVRHAEDAVASVLQAADTFTDGLALRTVLHHMPSGVPLFVGNSLPVRHLDEMGTPSSEALAVYANRGASGIDGEVSAALGVAAAHGGRVVAVLGDITFYHDMNGLLAVRRAGLSPVFVVLNNDGGGIFLRLPIAAHDPPFTDLFLTPHGLTFAPAAEMYGLHYAYTDGAPGLQAALRAAFDAGVPTLIEVRTDARTDAARRRTLLDTARANVASSLTSLQETTPHD